MSSYQYNSGGNGGDFPPSPPDILDLIAPQDGSSSGSVQPPPQSSAMQENRKVVLEQRTETVQQQPQQQNSTPQSTSPNEPHKKLTAAEIQRMKINAASEYYRKLRQGGEKVEANPGPPPPLIPTTSVQIAMANRAAPPTVVTSVMNNTMVVNAAQVAAPMPATTNGYGQLSLQTGGQQFPSNVVIGQSAVNKPNIDLGAIVRSTIINGVTKTFTQHWIVVGGTIRVLLLDFDGSFTLLIPGVEVGKAFISTQCNVEVQKKNINNGGQQLTFMKFTFASPPMEISAPVLLDKQMGYQVLKQNSACVFLGRILDSVKPPAPAPPPTIVASAPSLSQLLERQQAQESCQESRTAVPNLPRGTVILSTVASSAPPAAPVQVQVSPVVSTPVQKPVHYNHQQVQQKIPPSVHPQAPQAPIEPPKVPTPAPAPPSPAAEEPKKLVFVEDLKEPMYAALKAKELEKIIHCQYCPKKFKFLAEHLSHLKKHTQDVDSVVEISIKMWVPDRKLKCDQCKFKTCYTLDYAKHKDTHVIKGLACSICQCEVSTPLEYGEHMEIHHPSLVFASPEKPVEPPIQSSPATPSVESSPQQVQGIKSPIDQGSPINPSRQLTGSFQGSPQEGLTGSLVYPTRQVHHSPPEGFPGSPVNPVRPTTGSFAGSPVTMPKQRSVEASPCEASPVMPSPQQPMNYSPKVQSSPQDLMLQRHSSPHQVFYGKVQSCPADPEGPQKVLEDLLDGSPAGPVDHAVQDMPILETRQVSIRESLDSHEDELLEDVVNFSEELQENKQIDESVVSMANDLIGKIDEKFDESDDEEVEQTKEDEDLDFQLKLSDDDEELHKSIEVDNIFQEPNSAQEINSESSEAEVEEFKCEGCGAEFATPTSLKIHRLKCVKRKLQNNKQESPKRPDFVCQFCKDEFRSETSLKMHKSICSNKKKTETKPSNIGVVSSQEAKNPIETEQTPKEKQQPAFPLRREDPIRDFFEKEEMKKIQREEATKKKEKIVAPPAKAEEKIVSEPPAKTEEKIEEIPRPIKIRVPKPLPEQPPIPTNVLSNSILTRHLTSAKTEMNIEKVQKAAAPPLKLKISLPPKPKVKPAKKIPKIPILPPKPPILGAFVPKNNGSVSTKGKEIHELREKKMTPKVPKLVIKTKQLKGKKKIQPLANTIKPCKVALQSLTLPLSPPPIKLNIKPVVQQEPLVKKLVIKDIKPVEKLVIKDIKPVEKLVIKDIKKDNVPELTAKPIVENGAAAKIPVMKLNIKDIAPSVVEEKKVEKLTIKKPIKKRRSTDDFKEESPKKLIIKDVLPPQLPVPQEPIKRLNIKEIAKDEHVKPLNIKLPKPALKLCLKNLKSPPSTPEDMNVPSLKIKLPTKAKTKRGLMTILDGLTKNLPQPQQPEPKVPDLPTFPNKVEEPVFEESLIDHVSLDEALAAVSKENEAEKMASQILQELIDQVTQEPKILKPITLKVNNVEPLRIKKAKFKVIRVSQSNKKIKRSGSGLDCNDYKGKRRRKLRKHPKLDKLIIRNISNFLVEKPETPETICSSILSNTITNLPCFNISPIRIKITKDKLKRKDQDSTADKLKKQLEIDMVGGDEFFTEDILSSKRKAKLQAKQAFDKANATSKKKKKSPAEPIDPVQVESIFEQIMGDEESSSSSFELANNTAEKVKETIGKLVQEEICKEMKSSGGKQGKEQSKRSSKKEMWITNPPVFAKKSSAPQPVDEEVCVPLTEFESDSEASSSPNIVKSTIKAIQLKAEVPEVLEGSNGNKEVLDMIDDLFNNFFESCPDPSESEDQEDNHEDIVKRVLDDLISKVVIQCNKDLVVKPAVVAKRSRPADPFSRGGYAKRRRKFKMSKTVTTDSSEELTDSDGETCNQYFHASTHSLMSDSSISQDVVSVILDDLIWDAVGSNEQYATSDINAESGEESTSSSSIVSSAVFSTSLMKRKRKKHDSEASSESSFILQLDSDSSVDEFGKGKRKRFQNVRMMPIE